MGHHIFKTIPRNLSFFSVILTKMDLLFSSHLSFEPLLSTVWAWGTVETKGEVEGLLWARTSVSYFEFITEQTQKQGEGRAPYFRPSWLWQCFSTVLRLLGSSCPVQGPPVCHHQERHEFDLVCCQVSLLVGHSCTNKAGGFLFPGLTCQILYLGHTSFLRSWGSTLHLFKQEKKKTTYKKKTHTTKNPMEKQFPLM